MGVCVCEQLNLCRGSFVQVAGGGGRRKLLFWRVCACVYVYASCVYVYASCVYVYASCVYVRVCM